jgi:hypothetical protein
VSNCFPACNLPATFLWSRGHYNLVHFLSRIWRGIKSCFIIRFLFALMTAWGEFKRSLTVNPKKFFSIRSQWLYWKRMNLYLLKQVQDYGESSDSTHWECVERRVVLLLLHYYYYYYYYILVFYCVGSGYIVAFTNLMIYQIYHSWIHPLHCSPLSSLPHSRISFIRSHFFIYIHVYTVFAPYSPSHTVSPPPPPSHRYQPRRQDLFSCSDCPHYFLFNQFESILRFTSKGSFLTQVKDSVSLATF